MEGAEIRKEHFRGFQRWGCCSFFLRLCAQCGTHTHDPKIKTCRHHGLSQPGAPGTLTGVVSTKVFIGW